MFLAAQPLKPDAPSYVQSALTGQHKSVQELLAELCEAALKSSLPPTCTADNTLVAGTSRDRIKHAGGPSKPSKLTIDAAGEILQSRGASPLSNVICEEGAESVRGQYWGEVQGLHVFKTSKSWLTGGQFEALGGKKPSKNWKRSIKRTMTHPGGARPLPVARSLLPEKLQRNLTPLHPPAKWQHPLVANQQDWV
ncbi:hypothetical protein WJX72_000195 [[Myrmecia] bisecta]|uniref:SAND domain-containing protein n=1 Tax=[Myrmecia] bisecta TaxID=41462 RepID=A0AAW1R4B9_9CHLO